MTELQLPAANPKESAAYPAILNLSSTSERSDADDGQRQTYASHSLDEIRETGGCGCGSGRALMKAKETRPLVQLMGEVCSGGGGGWRPELN